MQELLKEVYGMDAAKILIVDDDANICEILRLYLVKEGFELVFAGNGSEALDRFRDEKPDLVLLDIMLPVISGWEVCKMMRASSSVPILMLSAKDSTGDKVTGLEIGADDYVVKPFDPKEVVARVKALLRRAVENKGPGTEGRQEGPAQEAADGALVLGRLEVNLSRYTVQCQGKQIRLKPKEIQLLAFLMAHPNIVFTREQLLEKVWGYDYMGETRTVDVHVKRLRTQLEKGKPGCRIATVWGVGYKLEVE